MSIGRTVKILCHVVYCNNCKNYLNKNNDDSLIIADLLNISCLKTGLRFNSMLQLNLEIHGFWTNNNAQFLQSRPSNVL